MKKITLMLLFIVATSLTWAQCVKDNNFGNLTLTNDGSVEQIAGNQWSTEHSEVTGFIDGDEYTIRIALNSDGSEKFVTISELADDTNVLAFGQSPLTFTANSIADLKLSWSDDAGPDCLGTESSHTTSVQNDTAAQTACLDVSGIGVANTTETTTDITWTPGAGNDSALVEVYAVDESAGNGDTPIYSNAAASGGTDSVTGLSGNTSYDAFVTGFCGATSTEVQGPFTFNTAAAPAACGGQFLDSGGTTSGYSANESTTTTIVPDNPGEVVTITFTYVDIEVNSTGTGSQDGCWDFMTIYNGPDNTFPALAVTLCGEESGDGGVPSVATSELNIGDSFTSTDASGALTIEFTSDGSAQETGWEADVTCGPAPTCTGPTIDSSTVVDNCNPDGTGTFTVDIVVSDAGDAGSVFDDGTNTYPVVSGTVTAGPYNSGDSVTITVDATDNDCDSTVGTFNSSCPAPGESCSLPISATVETDCSTATPITIDFSTAPDIGPAGSCDTTTGNIGQWFEFTAPASGTVTISNSGANNEYVILDACDGTEVLCGTMSASETISGLAASAVYKLAIWKDSFNSLTTDTFCIEEVNCTAPTIDSATEVEDTCNPDGTGTYNVEIVVSNAGDAGTVFDDGTNTYPVVAGTVIAGPYNSGDSVTITVDATDDVCDSTVGTFEFTCPQPAPDNNDCAGATALTVGGSFEDNPVVGSNVGATGSGELPLPGCDSYDPDDVSGFGGDVWYAVSVPSDGNLTVETQGNPVGNGGDTGIAVYTGTCGSLALFECNADDSDDGNYSLIDIEAADGLADQVVYVRVWEFSGNAELNFQVSAYSSTLSTTDLDNPAAFTYFPNPVKNTLNLNAQNTIENVRMYNMLGQEVLRATPNNVDSELDLSNLQTGTYFVKVTIASVTKTIRVVKQ